MIGHEDNELSDEVGDWFLDIQARLRRAVEVREQLIGEINGFVEAEHRFDLVRRDDGTVWDVVVRFGVKPDFRRWGVLFGDVLNNLRSSLDYLACHLVEATSTEDVSRTTSFPVARKQKEYEKEAERKLPGVPAELIERVRKTQPFVTGPDDPGLTALWLLHHAAARDRHRLVRPVVASMDAARNLDVSSSPGSHVEIRLNPRDGEPFLTLVQPEPTMDPPPVAIDIAFRVSVDLDVPIPAGAKLGGGLWRQLDRNQHRLGVEVGEFTGALVKEVAGIVRLFTDIG